MLPDISRTLVVLSREPHLWAALRDRLGSHYSLVRFSVPDELPEIWDSLIPWPWAVVSDCPALPEAALERLNGSPVALFWIGPRPQGLSAETIDCADWRAAATAISSAMGDGVEGLRLASVRGVVSAGSRMDRVELLENLIAAHPHSLPGDRVSTERTTRLNRLLARHKAPWKIVRRKGRLWLKRKDI